MTGYGETVTPKEILINDPITNTERLSKMEHTDDSKTKALKALKLLEIEEFQYLHILNSNTENDEEIYLDKDALLLHFNLEGDYTFKQLDCDKAVNFKNGDHNILFLPAQIAVTKHSLALKHEVISIYFDLNFILKYIPDNHLLLKVTKAQMLVPIVENNFSLNPKMHSILLEIINCSFEGHLKKLFTQAKIIELLTLQLILIEEEQKLSLKQSVLKPSDIEKMTQVKNIITSDLKATYSLASLARSVGTNEQYLKKNFKILYGKTVFNYLLDFKMEKAKSLLLNSDHKIADIANDLGYKHATHFSSAFKKHFGYIPQKIKSKLISFAVIIPFFYLFIIEN